MNNRGITGIAVDGLGKDIFDSVVAGDEVDAINEAQPEVTVLVDKHA